VSDERSLSDAARKASDEIMTHLVALGADAFGKWVAIRLSDGGTDGTLYETKAAAIDHQLHEHQCAYAQVLPGGMPAKDAEVFMQIHRRLYESGARITDPDRDMVIPSTVADRIRRQKDRALAARFLQQIRANGQGL